jgi:hypothetical protein
MHSLSCCNLGSNTGRDCSAVESRLRRMPRWGARVLGDIAAMSTMSRRTAATMSLLSAQRTYAVAMIATIGATLGVCGANFGKWPGIVVDATNGSVFWGTSTSSSALSFWGVTLYGIVGAALGCAIGIASASWWRSARARILLGAWAITALVLGVMFMAWSFWPW